MFLEWQTEFAKKGMGLFIGSGCRHESDLHSEDLRNLVDVDFREYDLFLDSEGIVALSVNLLGDSVEVPDTREGDADKPLKELIHPGGTESDLNSDRHSLTELEVGDVLP